MANPQVVSIPEWTWVKIATATKKIYMNRLSTIVYYYRTYRLTGEDAPPTPTVGEVPEEAVRLFDINHDEFIESSSAIDVYVMCSNSDDDSNETGKIYVGPDSSSLDINIQDQTTPDVILRANRVLSPFLLDGIQTRGIFTISVVAGHSAVAGDWVCIQQIDTTYKILRFYQAQIVVAGATSFEMDRPLDFPFDPTLVSCSNIARVNMANEVGTVSDPIIYSIKPSFGRWDITRMIVQIFSGGTMDDGKFGPLASLPHGITIRRKNDFWYNSLNWKNNGEMAAISFDTKYADKPPAGTGNGWTARLTWGGQNKIGVTKRLNSALFKGVGDDDELQVIIPDTLAAFGASDVFIITFEGHIVD